MLKLISKSFFVSVLCGSLMLMDFSYKGSMINSAQAESVKTDKITDKDLMGTLTMTVAGTIASRLYKYKMTTDIMLAAAGGAAFIGGEVLAFVKLKEVMKGMEIQITRDKNGNINKEQIEALERLKKSYEEAKKTATTKKTLQMAAAAAFAAAGVMAYTMATTEATNLTTCTTGVTTALSTATAALSCSAPTYGSCVAGVNACIAAIQSYSSAMMANEMSRQASGPSAQGLATATTTGTTASTALTAASTACASSGFAAGAGSSLVAACTPKHTIDTLQQSGGVMTAFADSSPVLKSILGNDELKKELIAELSVPNSRFEKYFNQAFNLIFPPAQAELFSAMGIASSAAVSYILATSATVGPTIDMFLLIPQKRAMAWGVLAGLTFAATSATNNVISQIEQNIKKIDAILNSMYQMAQGATATQIAHQPPKVTTTVKPGTQLQFNETDYGEVDLKKETGNGLPCYTGDDPKNCKSFEDSVNGTPSFSSLNLESQKQLSSILATANGLNGTSKISSATLKGAASMAGSANALRSAMDKAAKKNAETLKNSKIKFNNDEESKKLSDQIEKHMRDGLKKSNSTPSSMLASMYGGSKAIGSGTSNASTEKAKEEALAAPVVPAANVVDISAPSGGGTDLGITGMDNHTQLSAEEQARIDAAATASANAAGMDQYDLKNDISSDSTSSIFDLITNRYQKSGYPRLFKLKEQQPPAPVTK